ncbi:MAG: hypothetical protein ACTSRI_20135, partial [Promethearchaeota archaeon]
AFGYPGYIFLLSGMMSFSESDKASNGLHIEFLIHSQKRQSMLMRDFLGHGLHDNDKRDLSNTFLQRSQKKISKKKYPFTAFYFTSVLLSGFKLNDREIKPPENNIFLRKYFEIYAPKDSNDYKKVINIFLTSSYSKYNDLEKEDKFFSDMNSKGRYDFYKFLSKKLHDTIENIKKTKDIKPAYESLLYLKLMRYIMNPSDSYDPVRQLKNVLITGEPSKITLDIVNSNEPPITLEIIYDDLMNILTREMLFTMFFHYQHGSTLSSTHNRKNSGYFMDFDISWEDGLDEKTIKAFEFYVNMFEKAPEKQVTLEFYFSQPKGISTEAEITNRERGFNRFVITFDKTKPKQLQSAVLSMIFWTSLDPDIFVAAKSGGKYFSYCDAFGLKDHDYVSSSGYGLQNLDAQFWWTAESGDFTKAKYLALVEKFKNEVGFTLEDIKYVRGCHNHELSDKYDTIIEYAAYKYLKHFHINKKYKDGMILDLRKAGDKVLTLEQFEDQKK